MAFSSESSRYNAKYSDGFSGSLLRNLSELPWLQLAVLALCLGLHPMPALAQVSASLSGVVTAIGCRLAF